MQLVQATQMVATRTSLVQVGASSHLGQLLPTALQLWSQDRLSQQGRGAGQQRSFKTVAQLEIVLQRGAQAHRCQIGERCVPVGHPGRARAERW